MKNFLLFLIFISFFILTSLSSCLFTYQYFIHEKDDNKKTESVEKQDVVDQLPLNKYSISNLKNYPYKTSQITVEELIDHNQDSSSYLFSYITSSKKMTGMINIPTQKQDQYKIIVMLRGWAPKENYYSGLGTKNASLYFAKNGYITIAPDFFGFGSSDDESDDSWEARFIKPVNVIELIKTVQSQDVINISADINLSENDITCYIDHNSLAMWAHSNGGQIALTVLEVLEDDIPTSLWAPVTAPFPYSILFFSDEAVDEGKQLRKYLSIFEKKYDVFDFTITKHLDKLHGNINLHHGTADEAALIAWSNEFVQKIEKENERRAKLDSSDDLNKKNIKDIYIDKINIIYNKYNGADHNLRPSWNTVVNKDLIFYSKYLDD